MPRTLSPLTAVIGVILLTACSSTPLPTPTATATPTPTATGAPTPSLAPATPETEPGAIDSSAWQRWSPADGLVAVRYPQDWSAKEASWQLTDAAEGERSYDSLALTSEANGQELLYYAEYVDRGGACTPDSEHQLVVLASEPAPHASTEDHAERMAADGQRPVEEVAPVIASYALQQEDGRWRMAVALTEAWVAEADSACTIDLSYAGGTEAFRFATYDENLAEDPLWTVGSLDDARAYMQTGEYATILEILRTFRAS